MKIIIVSVVVTAGFIGGLLFYHSKQDGKHDCVSYYGKDGKQLLYKDCQQ
ncbi:MAG TPA: hypothetical protein VF466_03905 [Candidatus Saccharimonadales bacterium]